MLLAIIVILELMQSLLSQPKSNSFRVQLATLARFPRITRMSQKIFELQCRSTCSGPATRNWLGEQCLLCMLRPYICLLLQRVHNRIRTTYWNTSTTPAYLLKQIYEFIVLSLLLSKRHRQAVLAGCFAFYQNCRAESTLRFFN